MNRFGVIELSSGKNTTAPGWAYVPEIAPDPGAVGIQPTNRKRARGAATAGPALGDAPGQQETKMRKELEAMERDRTKENSIQLPTKNSRSQAKCTSNVRRILQSSKAFENYYDIFQSSQTQAEANGRERGRRSAAGKKGALPKQQQQQQENSIAKGDDTTRPATDMNGRSLILRPVPRSEPTTHSGDDNPLLVSRVPSMPSEEELRKLLAHPPLMYIELTGTSSDTYPIRVFCEVCGYWGRVRCAKCGKKVCALDCLETHREECLTRYGL